MKHFESTVIANQPICEGWQELTLCWNRLSGTPLPGQFLTIRVAQTTAPLLRRPFAFSGFDAQRMHASVIYQKRGAATDVLAGKSAGEAIDVIGPLGIGFTLPDEKARPILVAGGIGLGPILFLAQELRRQGRDPLFVFGCRTQDQIPRSNSFSDAHPVVCTDDGTAGFAGTSVAYLRTLPQSEFANAKIFACGPTPMLRACHELALEKDLPCDVSVEQVMACGVGACMGCAVKITKAPGYARACTEGPVFQSRDMAW